jgi:hypothetical protein
MFESSMNTLRSNKCGLEKQDTIDIYLVYQSHILFWLEEALSRFEVFTAVSMKSAIFWDVALCGYCKNRRFSLVYLSPLKIEETGSSETSVLLRSTRATTQKMAFFLEEVNVLVAKICTNIHKSLHTQVRVF